MMHSHIKLYHAWVRVQCQYANDKFRRFFKMCVALDNYKSNIEPTVRTWYLLKCHD